MKRSTLPRAALLASFLAVCACDDSSSSPQVAGGEDFPNTVAGIDVLARLAREASDSSGDWNILSGDVSSLPDAELDTTAISMTNSVAIVPPMAARAAASTTDYDLSDTARGVVVVRTHALTTAVDQYDTIWVAWDERARDTIEGNERVYRMSSRKTSLSTLRMEYSAAVPVAPDTMLTPLTGKVNRIHLHQYVELGRSATVLEMELDPGLDLSYDTESDNRIRWASAVRLRGSDTLETSAWTDGDGDSIALDRATGKPGVVRSVRTIPTPSSVRLKRVEERGRLLVDPRDSTATQALRFERRELWASGRVMVERVARAASDSDLVAGDTAHVWRRAVLGGDTIETRFDLLMGDPLSDSTSRRLLGYSVRHRNAQGRILSLSFVSDAPMRPVDSVLTGMVVFDARLASGRSFHLDGRWDRGALSGHVDDGEGLAGAATWDATGTLILWKPD